MAIEIETATIVPADRMVAVNGDAYWSADFVFTPPLPGIGIAAMNGPPAAGRMLHAIRWFGDHGQIETSFGPPVSFTDRAIVDPYLPQWLMVRAAQTRRQADYAAAQVQLTAASIADLQQAQDALAADVSAAAARADVPQSRKDALVRHARDLAARIAALQARHATQAGEAAAADAEALAAAADALHSERSEA